MNPRTHCIASAYASPVAALMAPRMCARPAAAESVVVLRAAEDEPTLGGLLLSAGDDGLVKIWQWVSDQ